MTEGTPRDAQAVVLDRIEDDIQEIRRAIEGDRFSGQLGVIKRLEKVEIDLRDMQQARIVAQAERAGQKKLLNIIGWTSVAGVVTTMFTLVTVLLAVREAIL